MKPATKPPKRRVTVVEVARAAGVSPGTVSNTISGKRKVDAETRKRIETAIRELGYVPNLVARGMRTGRANTIAIFSSMPTAVAAGSSKLGFLMEIAASAAEAALERNMALVLIPPIEDPVSALNTIPYDGALLVEPAAGDPFQQLLEERDVPFVVIGQPPRGDAPYVDLDYAEMAALLVDHLFSVGARDFPLMIGQSARQSNIVFRDVYCARATAAGMMPNVMSLPESRAEEAAAIAIRQAVARNPALDGVLVPIDAMATGVMQGLRDCNRRVPGDVRVATRYDGIRARTETPPLTALNLHLDQVALLATRALLDLIEGGQGPVRTEAPRPALIVRGATFGAP